MPSPTDGGDENADEGVDWAVPTSPSTSPPGPLEEDQVGREPGASQSAEPEDEPTWRQLCGWVPRWRPDFSRQIGSNRPPRVEPGDYIIACDDGADAHLR